ncbi:MAG: hypothetical protein V1854_04870 [Methanobacteriota archaeon]
MNKLTIKEQILLQANDIIKFTVLDHPKSDILKAIASINRLLLLDSSDGDTVTSLTDDTNFWMINDPKGKPVIWSVQLNQFISEAEFDLISQKRNEEYDKRIAERKKDKAHKFGDFEFACRSCHKNIITSMLSLHDGKICCPKCNLPLESLDFCMRVE